MADTGFEQSGRGPGRRRRLTSERRSIGSGHSRRLELHYQSRTRATIMGINILGPRWRCAINLISRIRLGGLVFAGERGRAETQRVAELDFSTAGLGLFIGHADFSQRRVGRTWDVWSYRGIHRFGR